jgi:hypothetical protein
MKKTVQIVTIPLSSREGFHQKGDLIKLINLIKNNDKYKLGDLRITPVKWDAVEPNDTWQAQQLLVLSDDEIKESDRSQILDLDINQVFCNIANTISSTHVRISKLIASYPQIEGTLPISKETVQAWIDSGTPGGGVIFYDNEPDNLLFDPQGNLLLEFGKKYKSTGNDLGDLAERAIDKIIANATTKPSIPTDEEILKKSLEHSNNLYNSDDKCKDNILSEHQLWENSLRDYEAGYKQALKDLGYE